MGAPEAAVSFAKPPSSDTTAHSGDGTNASDQQPATTKRKKTPGGGRAEHNIRRRMALFRLQEPPTVMCNGHPCPRAVAAAAVTEAGDMQ
jgi:hypothetical protein